MNGFPSEEQLPTHSGALYELLQAARDAKLSFRYTNVIRHRLMDAVARNLIADGTLREESLR